MSVFAIVTSLAAAAEEAHAEASSAGLPQLDPTWWPSQLFWLVVTFGVLYAFMSSKALPSLGGAIEERRDRIADDLDQAGDFKREAEEAEAAYNQSLADAKAKAQAIAADTRAEMDAEIAKLQAETDAKLEAKLGEAEGRISEMKKAAAVKVSEAASETTRAIVEALIDEAPTQDAAARAVASIASR